VIITTNLGFADWTQVCGDANMTAALPDHLTHRARVIVCTLASYRLTQAMKTAQASRCKAEREP
jgi:DNA replication protein DnaC